MKLINIITLNLVIQSTVLTAVPPNYGNAFQRTLSCPIEQVKNPINTNTKQNFINSNYNFQNIVMNTRPSIYSKHNTIFFACPCAFEFEGVYRALRENKKFVERYIDLKEVKIFSHENTSIVLYICGKGYFNPGVLTTQLLFLIKGQCDAVFMFGSCGSLSDDIIAGDICIPLAFNDANSGRYIGSNQNGETLRNVTAGKKYNNLYVNPDESRIYPSEDLVNFVMESIDNETSASVLKFEEFSEDRSIIVRTPINLVTPQGIVSSGSFTHSPSMASLISECFNSEIVDMETYPLAYACRSFNVPFVAIRVPSDDAGRNGYNMIDNGGRYIASTNLGVAANVIASSLANLDN